MAQRRNTNPPARADALADIVLRDHDDNAVRLGELWSERPVALVWLRHYGWVYCRDHAVQLHRARSKFEDAGVPLVLIGQATARHAAHFRRRMGIDFPVLADEQRESYRAAGAKMGSTAELVGPKAVLVGATRVIRSGPKAMQGRTVGHVAQLGGAMVIAPDGSVTWSHMAEDITDTAGPDEILEAARAAGRAA